MSRRMTTVSRRPARSLARLALLVAGVLAPVAADAQAGVKDELLVKVPVARAPNPDAVAIVIGNRNYLQKTLPPVEFAERDAWAVRQYLISAFGLDSSNVVYLENATQGQMRSFLGSAEQPNGKLKRMLRPGKSDVYVFYSGHGAPDLKTSNAYLVPVDGDPSDMANSGYAVDVLYKNLSLMGARSVTVMMDACFSGLSEGGSLYTGTSGGRLRVTNPVVAAQGTAALLAASNNQMAVWHQEKQHGAFTYYLLKGIQELAAKSPEKITLGTVHDYVSENVRYYAGRVRNLDQDTQLQARDTARVLASLAAAKFVDMPAKGEPKPIVMVRKTAEKAPEKAPEKGGTVAVVPVPVGTPGAGAAGAAGAGAAGAAGAGAALVGSALSAGASAVPSGGKTAAADPSASKPPVTVPVAVPTSAPTSAPTTTTMSQPVVDALAIEVAGMITAKRYDEVIARFKEGAPVATRNRLQEFFRKNKPRAKVVRAAADPLRPGVARLVLMLEYTGSFGNSIGKEVEVMAEHAAGSGVALLDVLNLP